MSLLGKANWWLPAWLDQILPRLLVESSTTVEAAPVPIAGEDQLVGR
jgi:putative drug exporter of the RND superfamily